MPPCPPHTVAHHHTHIVHAWSHLPWEALYPDKWVSVFAGVIPVRLIARGIDEVTRLFSNEYCFNVSGVGRQVDASESKKVTNWNGRRIEVVDLKRKWNIGQTVVSLDQNKEHHREDKSHMGKDWKNVQTEGDAVNITVCHTAGGRPVPVIGHQPVHGPKSTTLARTQCPHF